MCVQTTNDLNYLPSPDAGIISLGSPFSLADRAEVAQSVHEFLPHAGRAAALARVPREQSRGLGFDRAASQGDHLRLGQPNSTPTNPDNTFVNRWQSTHQAKGTSCRVAQTFDRDGVCSGIVQQ